jgi:hypothetical protein
MPKLTAFRSSIRRAVALAAPAALVISALAAGHAGAITDAEKYGTVTIVDASAGVEVVKGGEPHVCNFWFEFDLGIQADVVGWKVKQWNAAPLDGTTVLKGQGGPTDADGKLRVPDSGSLSVPNGRYNVVWDDEYPPDGSNGARSFVVDCEAAQPTPTPTPTATPTDQGTGGTQPTGSVLDLGAGGGGITPPPTDAAPAVAPQDNDLGTLAAAATLILAVLVGALTLIPRRAIDRAARNR